MTDTREKYAPMKNIVVTTEGVEKLLSNLNLTWALGTDMITQSPQGTLQGNSSDPYHRQQSLNTGDVPADWSEAVLTPVYKTGEHYDSANDCPLSLTSIPCNVLVHIIVNGMMGHLETSKILSDSQHRFIKFRSCKTQLFGYLRYGVPQGWCWDLSVSCLHKWPCIKAIYVKQETDKGPAPTLWDLRPYWNETRGCSICLLTELHPHSGELRTQKLKSHLERTQSLNVLPLKPGVGQHMPYTLRLLSGISSLLISTLPVHLPAFFPKHLLIFLVLAVANTWFLCRPTE